MSQSDLARATGLTRQAISYYLGEKSKRPDDDALQAISRVFKLPPEQVYRAAGLLPPKPESDPWVEEMAHKLASLPPNLRRVATGLIDSLLRDEVIPAKRGTK